MSTTTDRIYAATEHAFQRMDQGDPRELFRLLDALIGSMKAEWDPAHQARLLAERERQLKRIAEQNRAAIVKDRSDVELRLAVIDELVSQGIARPVAAERTRNPQKMFELAEQFGLV